MDLLFVGLTLGVIGKILLGVSVIFVHNKMAHEHRIDKIVIHEMKRERNIAIWAITLILVGYVLELAGFGYFGNGLLG